jgi:uncharacterized protein YjiS (DUF1127 family)
VSVQIFQEAPTGRSPGHVIVPEIRKSALSASLHFVAAWIARSAQRRALRELAEDGRLLNDIGLTHEQVLREAGKPFWHR